MTFDILTNSDTTTESDASPVPAWVRDAVFYQIFPDRFAKADPSIDPEGVVPWESAPTRGNFFGGDLAGITQRLDHIEALGANALYLTPIFEADTNHRYDAADYFRIDHRLGDFDAFQKFLDAAHERGIRVVLDAVFNHCGEGHWAFRHVYAHGAESPYADWFTVDELPIVRDPEPNYATCMGCKYLPQLNHANPEVREHLLEVARFWAEKGIDGWRLDVPFLVEQDFWREFRREVKSVDEDLYVVAEIWTTAKEWLEGDIADGTMNYPLREIIVDFAQGKESAATTGERLRQLYLETPARSRQAMLNLLGSHDTERIRTRLGWDRRAERIASLLLLTSPGAPMIYYGDEVGLAGENDPGCRGSMPWDPAHWDRELFDWHRRLIALRKAHPGLRGFEDEVVPAADGLLVRRRSDGSETLWVVVNQGPESVELALATVDGAAHDLLGEAEVERSGTSLQVPAGAMLVLQGRVA